MSFKPIDGAKEDFRKYLDRKGVMDALTKAFVLCYDERPENPIERLVDVIADNAKILGASSELKSRLMNTELELKQARSEIDLLRKQLTDLGVTPVSVPSLSGAAATGNGPTIATLSAEAEKTVPSSNTSAVENTQHTVNTGAIPKTPQPAVATPAPTTTENAASDSPATDASTTTNSPPTTSSSSNTNNTTGAKTEEDTSGQTQVVTAATNTEESATKEAAT